MKPKFLEIILLAGILLGGALAWRTGRERSRLEQQYERLVRVAGDLQVEDASKVHVLALETGEPLHFAWRVYLPPNYTQTLRDSEGGSGRSWSGGQHEFIARVRFREDGEGGLRVYRHFSGGSSMSALDPAMAALLRGRWDEVHVEQLGAAHQETLGADRPAVLLRLTLPDDMQDEARRKLSAHTLKHHVPLLYELKLGPESSKP